MHKNIKEFRKLLTEQRDQNNLERNLRILSQTYRVGSSTLMKNPRFAKILEDYVIKEKIGEGLNNAAYLLSQDMILKVGYSRSTEHSDHDTFRDIQDRLFEKEGGFGDVMIYDYGYVNEDSGLTYVLMEKLETLSHQDGIVDSDIENYLKKEIGWYLSEWGKDYVLNHSFKFHLKNILEFLRQEGIEYDKTRNQRRRPQIRFNFSSYQIGLVKKWLKFYIHILKTQPCSGFGCNITQDGFDGKFGSDTNMGNLGRRKSKRKDIIQFDF